MKNDNIDEVILLSAGLGTRLKPVTKFVPKPMVPIFSIPLIQSHLDAFAEIGIRRVIINIHHLAQNFLEILSGLDTHNLEIVISDESHLLLNSAGGLVTCAQKIVGDRFFWVNADNCMLMDWRALEQQHQDQRLKEPNYLMTMVLKRKLIGQNYRSVFWNEDSFHVSGLGALDQGVGDFFIGAGVLERVALSGLLPNRPYEFVNDLFNPLNNKNAVAGYRSDGFWMDIGTPKGWYEAHQALLLPENLSEFSLSFQKRLRAAIDEGYQVDLNSYVEPRFRVNYPIHSLGRGVLAYGVPPLGASVPEVLDHGIVFGGEWIQL